MNKLFLILILFFQCNFLTAQTSSISTVEICAGQEVLLPVTGANLLSVGALTIYIGFDTNNLSFLSVENIDPRLDGMSTNLMLMPTQLAFAWSSTEPLNFLNEKLFDIRFQSNGISAGVYYNSDCELSDTNGVVIPVTYIDGAVNSGVPLVYSNPADTTVLELGTAVFSVQTGNASSFLWRESTDNGVSWLALDDNELYSGTHTDILMINGVPLSFNDNLYQCVLYHGLCQKSTEHAHLKVDKLSDLAEKPYFSKAGISISPVPFDDFCIFEFSITCQSNVQIQVVNQLGQLIVDIESPSVCEGYHHIKFNTSDWNSGMYMFRMHATSPEGNLECVKKVIRK